jgi:hypothetical protein
VAKGAIESVGHQADVAQIYNLLYRGFSIRTGSEVLPLVRHRAECNSAIRQIANLRYGPTLLIAP